MAHTSGTAYVMPLPSPCISSEAQGFQGKHLPDWCGSKPRGFGLEQQEESRRCLFLQHCGKSLPRKWEVGLDLLLPAQPSTALLEQVRENGGSNPVWPVGSWLVLVGAAALLWFHLGASSPQMHVNWGLREDLPPTGQTPWDGPDLHSHLPILPCSLGS